MEKSHNIRRKFIQEKIFRSYILVSENRKGEKRSNQYPQVTTYKGKITELSSSSYVSYVAEWISKGECRRLECEQSGSTFTALSDLAPFPEAENLSVLYSIILVYIEWHLNMNMN